MADGPRLAAVQLPQLPIPLHQRHKVQRHHLVWRRRPRLPLVGCRLCRLQSVRCLLNLGRNCASGCFTVTKCYSWHQVG